MTDKQLLTKYRYTWGGKPRVMTVELRQTECTVTDDSDGESVVLTWNGTTLTGNLSDTRKREIAALLTAAMQEV